jgi:deoxyribose-phosphate aldolase
MKLVVGNKAQVKASGGVRTYSDAVAMIRVGASRIGTSAGLDIVNSGKEVERGKESFY